MYNYIYIYLFNYLFIIYLLIIDICICCVAKLMWQWVSTSSQRVAHSFSIGLEVVQSGFTMKLKEKGLRHTHIHHACHSTNRHDCTRRYISTCLPKECLWFNRVQAASENLRRLDMYSLSTLAWLSPCLSCVKC